MAFIYESEDYKKDLTTYANRADVCRNRVEQIKKYADPEASALQPYGKTVYIYKFKNGFRILFRKVNIKLQGSNYDVYCLMHFTSHAKYEPIYNDPDVKTWEKEHPIEPGSKDYEAIKKWLEEQLAKPVNVPKPLDEDLREWLEPQNDFSVSNEIFEMHEWITAISSDDWRDDLKGIQATIAEIFDNKMVDNKAIVAPRVSIKMVKVPNSNVYILYEKQGDSLFLYTLCKNEPDREEIIAFLSNFDYDVEENSIVSRLKEDARRAYPSFILIDYDLWKDIENDGVGNLALSSEQVDIMRNPDYPIFINGQAGSGKSTILYYLFANILYKHKDNSYEPIFLTYNARLLETAKKCVKAILAKHPNYSDSNYPVDNIDKFFHPFQKFILEKMLDERGREKFTKDKYISFNKFKRYYTTTGHKCSCKLNLNKNLYSPELVWYIIRSYIKGRSLDEFTIDDYNSLERGDKTVSPDIIDYVIKNIWQGWYKNLYEEEGYWDDQDLVQYALNTPIEFDRYPLIFCDESQDFTRNEIELILQLSIYTDNYDMEHYKQLPMAFAGDPYQTINPTGFRWASLQSMFNNTFKEMIRNKYIITPVQLLQNYRSKPAIIQFANYIQFCRKVFLNDDLSAQKLRGNRTIDDRSRGFSPCLLQLGDNIHDEDLQRRAGKTTIVVPSEDGNSSERDFVKEDLTLSSVVDTSGNEDDPITNIYSAASSKGLEFDKVIVYKFGAACPDSFRKSIKGDKLSDSEEISLSHYFNKLYVAVSRAKNELFIVDNKEGYEKFWQFFIEGSVLESNSKYFEWHDDIEHLVKGEPDDISRIEEKNPIVIAEELYQKGRETENADWMKRAAKYYGWSRKYAKANECRAWALLYESQWLEAGNTFKQLEDDDKGNFKKKAKEAYWNGNCWQELIDLPADGFTVKIAQFMMDKLSIEAFLNDEHFIDLLITDDNTSKLILEKVKRDIRPAAIDNKKKAAFCREIATSNPIKCKAFFDIAAELFYLEGLFKFAAAMWEKGEKGSEHTDYYKAKLNDSFEPDEIIKWNSKLKNHDEVLKYKGTKDLSAESHSFIFTSMTAKGNFDDALEYSPIPESRRIEAMLRLADSYVDKNRTAIRESVIKKVALDGNMELFTEKADLFADTLVKNSKLLSYILSSTAAEEMIEAIRPTMAKTKENSLFADCLSLICTEIKDGYFKNINLAMDIVTVDPDHMVSSNAKIFKALAQTSGKLPLDHSAKSRIVGLINKWFWEESEWHKVRSFTAKDLILAANNCNAFFSDIYPMCEHLIQYEPKDAEWAKDMYLQVKEKEYYVAKDEKTRTELRKELIAKKVEWGRDKYSQELAKKAEKEAVSAKSEKPAEVKPEEDKNKAKSSRRAKLPKTFEYNGISFYGLDGIEPKIDDARRIVVYTLENYELKIVSRTGIVRIEDLNTLETHTINLTAKTFDDKKITRSKTYNTRIDDLKNKVTIVFDDKKVQIEKE